MNKSYDINLDLSEVTKTIFVFDDIHYNGSRFYNENSTDNYSCTSTMFYDKRVKPVCLYDDYYFLETVNEGIDIFKISTMEWVPGGYKDGTASRFKEDLEGYVTNSVLLLNMKRDDPRFDSTRVAFMQSVKTDRQYKIWGIDRDGRYPGISVISANSTRVGRAINLLWKKRSNIEEILPELKDGGKYTLSGNSLCYKGNVKYWKPFFGKGNYFSFHAREIEPYSVGCVVEDAVVEFLRKEGYPV